jgi:hypothetical protein
MCSLLMPGSIVGWIRLVSHGARVYEAQIDYLLVTNSVSPTSKATSWLSDVDYRDNRKFF